VGVGQLAVGVGVTQVRVSVGLEAATRESIEYFLRASRSLFDSPGADQNCSI
jgi:hypothetical protein